MNQDANSGIHKTSCKKTAPSSDANRDGSKETVKSETCACTTRLRPETDRPEAGKQTEEISLVWYGLTDTGRVRPQNEDFFCCAELPEGVLFVVADGMGGHDAGEVASRLATETASREIVEHAGMTAPGRLLEQAVRRANDEVLREANSKGSNMGTTISLALVCEGRAYIANVGDSRVYWIENGSINRITVDHSLVEKLVSLGKIPREKARTHPRANVLYRNIGSEGPLPVDIFEVPLEKEGSLLLCTDGLWGEMPDEDIHKIFMDKMDAETICTALVKAANENGGKDNITAIVVKVV